MAKNVLKKDVRRKLVSYLRSKGQIVNNLNESEITELYWKMINESTDEEDTVEEEVVSTVTTYTPDDDDDEVAKAIKGAKEENVTYNSDGSISIKKESIESMVTETQNPIMSKSELIQEMSRQLIDESNKYEDEYNSGNNEYSKHLDPDSVRDMGRRLYNDIRSAAEEKLGGANIDRATREMSGALMNILQYEMDKKPQLQEEAIRLIRNKYPAMTDDVVDIDAIITGHPDMGGRNVDAGNMRYEKGNTPPPAGYSEEELKSEVTKRRLINAMSQGSARKSQNLHHLADESRIPGRMKSQYGKLMAANDFVYWALDRETIRQQGRGGVHAGNSKIQLNPNTGKPKVIAQGMTFSILLHELDKGIKELIALHGTHGDMELNKYVQDQVDHLDAEQDDIRLGVGIWEKVSQKIDIDNPSHEALLFHKIVSLPSTEMNSLIKGLVSDNENSINKLQEIADEASTELRQEEYDDAIGTYDEPNEPTPAGEDEGPEGQYSDPELERILGGSTQEPSGESDYANMSQSQLQELMDDALDNGDFELASKIGPYLS